MRTIITITVATLWIVLAAAATLAFSPGDGKDDPGHSVEVNTNVDENRPDTTEVWTSTAGSNEGDSNLAASSTQSFKGCEAKSHNPHISSKEDNHVAAKGHTKCRVNYPVQEVHTVLKRHRWWGWQTIDYDPDVKFFADAFSRASRNCLGWGTYNYLNEGDHYLVDIENERWYAGTRNPATGSPNITLTC